jgi:hypothetical protein
MSINIEIAGSMADSYVSVEEADIYLQNRVGFDITEWIAQDADKKEFELKFGARIVDSLSYRGMRATKTQALAFPRIFPRDDLYIEDASGYPMPFKDWASLTEYAELKDLPAPAIPEDVKSAQIEITFQIVFSHLMTLGPMDTGEMDITSLGIDVINLSFGKATTSAYNIFTKDQFGAIAPVRLYLNRYMGPSAVLI